jgi:hypothetical protein
MKLDTRIGEAKNHVPQKKLVEVIDYIHQHQNFQRPKNAEKV